MLKALMLFLRCAFNIEKEVKYSFSISRYNDENEIYLDISNVDINIGVTKYTVKNIIYGCRNYLDFDTKKFLEFFLQKFLRKNNIKDGTVYIDISGKIIRIRNKNINEQSVLRINISK